jgi:hypothetical protein
MKNEFFKLAFPSFPPSPGLGRRELYFWVLFAALHVLLGTGLVALLPYRPPGRPEPGAYLSPAEVSKPPGGVRPVRIYLPAHGPLPALVHFPVASGCP